MLIKKVCLAIVLAGVSCGALAEWSKVGEGDDAVVYINIEPVRISGGMPRIWSLMDLKTPERLPGGMDYQSNRTLFELNCKEGLYRRLSIDVFAGKMAKGAIILRSETPSGWSHVAPDSLVESTFTFGCLFVPDPK